MRLGHMTLIIIIATETTREERYELLCKCEIVTVAKGVHAAPIEVALQVVVACSACELQWSFLAKLPLKS